MNTIDEDLSKEEVFEQLDKLFTVVKKNEIKIKEDLSKSD